MQNFLKFLGGAVAFVAVAFIASSVIGEALGSHEQELGTDEMTLALAGGMAVGWFWINKAK